MKIAPARTRATRCGVLTARQRFCADSMRPALNARARLLYRRTGFNEVGVRPGYYQPSGADAIVMCLRIPRPAELGKTGVP